MIIIGAFRARQLRVFLQDMTLCGRITRTKKHGWNSGSKYGGSLHREGTA
ncbi:MAG: hypothetical protein WC342_10090 [Methanoregula sp.]